MNQDILKINEYTRREKYEFFYVKCCLCGEKSNNVLYQSHLTGDDTISYIERETGFIQQRSEKEKLNLFVYEPGRYGEGGMICHKCQIIENKNEEVING